MKLNINIQGECKGETYQDFGGLPPLLNNFLWETMQVALPVANIINKR